MNIEEKYKGLLDFYDWADISEEYPDANYFEKSIILMRKNGYTYQQIQKVLGNPSKKQIRDVLLRFNPELIDNSIKKNITPISAYSELYNILAHTNRTIWEIFGDDASCYIKDKKIYYNEDLLDSYSIVEQTQVLNEIKSQL